MAIDALDIRGWRYQSVIEEEIDGLSLTTMGVAEAASLGASIGNAHNFVNSRSNYFEALREAPPDGVNVSLDVSLLRIGEVKPPSGFEVEIRVAMAWQDPRISNLCAGVKTWSNPWEEGTVDFSDSCTLIWRPRLLTTPPPYPNPQAPCPNPPPNPPPNPQT